MNTNSKNTKEKIIDEIFCLLPKDKQKTKKEIDFLLREKEEYDRISKLQKEYLLLLEDVKTKTDAEQNELVEKELESLDSQKKELLERIEKKLLNEENITKGALIEMRSGTGGLESSHFLNDLYKTYHKFASRKEWKIEIIESKADKEGNLYFISFLIKNKEAFIWFKNESGVHRVQRIPPTTEAKNRTHTSTISVVVLLEASELALNIKSSELKIDTYRSSGAGGQHVNTTDSAVRITHLPTGLVAISQDGRSQHSNKEKALSVLKARLFKKKQEEENAIMEGKRSSTIGRSERPKKIRTYNFLQNRVTDHRIDLSLNILKSFMGGDCGALFQALINKEIELKLEDILASLQ